MRTALEHAKDWDRSALKVGLVCFALTLLTFWAAKAGFGQVFHWAAYVSALVAVASIFASFILRIRIYQLSRRDD